MRLNRFIISASSLHAEDKKVYYSEDATSGGMGSWTSFFSFAKVFDHAEDANALVDELDRNKPQTYRDLRVGKWMIGNNALMTQAMQSLGIEEDDTIAFVVEQITTDPTHMKVAKGFKSFPRDDTSIQSVLDKLSPQEVALLKDHFGE